MKTKFFRKLSFVLVVAMVLSLFVPAAGAFAAAKPKLNSTNKYLHLGVAKKDEFNFNIANKQKGWKYYWESADEDVAEVNEKNGVTTAVGVGKTKITCEITDADGEEVAVLEATVTVRDNIKEVKISNPVEGTLAVGATHDFNRSFVTVSGSTKKTSAITRWSVEPDDGATIDDKGVFVATKAGEYKVIARSFQSKARYTAWQEDAEKYADYVLATDETKVVVAGSMVEAKQVDLNTFTVTFDSPMVKEDLEKSLKLSYVAGSTKVTHLIKEVKLDDAGKLATVDVYSDFVKDATYVVDYLEMDSVEFKSATTNVKDVVNAAIITKTVQIAVPEEIEIALYNVNGVNIANSELLGRVTLETSNNATFLNGKELSMYKVGDTTTIKATYHTYEHDLTTGLEIGVVTVEGIVACVEKKVATTGLLNAYTVVADKSGADFGNVKHQIAAGDTGLFLAVELLGKEANGWQDKKTNNKVSNTVDGKTFKFKSSNPDVLIVGEDGSVYPVKEGQASVVVTYDNVVVGAALITVVGARRVTSVNLSAHTVKLSNHPQVKDYKEITVEVKDQLGDNYPAAKYQIETKVTGNASETGLLKSAAGASTIKFEGTGIAEGSYTYTVKITDMANGWTSTSRFISVSVATPSSNDIHHYALESTQDEYDMNINTWDGSYTEDVTISLFGYATNGVRNYRVDLGNTDIKVTIKEPNGDKYGNYSASDVKAISATGSNLILPLVKEVQDDKIPAKGNIIKKMNTGTYVLEALDASGKAVNATYFAVKNTQAAPTLVVNKLYTDKTTLVAAINDCFNFNLNGSDLEVDTLIAENTAGDTGKTVLVKSVFVYQNIAGSKIRHEVKVNTVIYYAQ